MTLKRILNFAARIALGWCLLYSTHLLAETLAIKTILMKLGDTTYNHEIYSNVASKGKQPGIILVPEYWGKDELEEVQARQLAAKGFVVLVMDLYGSGKHTTQTALADKMQAEAEAGGLDPLLDLISSSIQVLKSDPNVDAKRIGAVGFGYGGGLLLNLAKRNTVKDLKSVVSFYGGVKKISETSSSPNLPSLLYVRPELDAYTTDDDFAEFKKEMAKTNFKFQALRLKDTHYGFIHKPIESYGTDDGNTFMFYEPKSAEKAWGAVIPFLTMTLK